MRVWAAGWTNSGQLQRWRERRKSLGMPSWANEVVRAHSDHRCEWKQIDRGLFASSFCNLDPFCSNYISSLYKFLQLLIMDLNVFIQFFSHFNSPTASLCFAILILSSSMPRDHRHRVWPPFRWVLAQTRPILAVYDRAWRIPPADLQSEGYFS